MNILSLERASQAVEQLAGEGFFLSYQFEGSYLIATTWDEHPILLKIASSEMEKQRYLERNPAATVLVVHCQPALLNGSQKHLGIRDIKSEILTAIEFLTSMHEGYDA